MEPAEWLGNGKESLALAYQSHGMKCNGIAVNCGAKDMDRMATLNINYNKNQEGMTNG